MFPLRRKRKIKRAGNENLRNVNLRLCEPKVHPGRRGDMGNARQAACEYDRALELCHIKGQFPRLEVMERIGKLKSLLIINDE